MSITLRSTVDTATSQTYGYANKTTPLTSEEVDKNFITIKQKIDEIKTDYSTTFNEDGSLKDGAVTDESIADNSVTSAKLKDRTISWPDQRNAFYVTDTSTTVNRVDGKLENYLANTGLTELPSDTIIYFKVANENTGSVTLVIKDRNTTTEKDTTLVSLEVLKQRDASLALGDVKPGGVYAAFYDGTTLQLVNSLPDPVVEVKESISRVQTFGPILFDIDSLKVNGTETEKAHLLGARPTSFTAVLECTGEEVISGSTFASVGDLIPLSSVVDTNNHPAIFVRVEDEFVYVSVSNTTSGVGDDPVIKVIKPSSGLLVALDATKWRVVIRGTYQNDSTYSPAFVDRSLTYPSSYPGSAISHGSYLYVWSAPNRNNAATSCTLTKTNLVTNRMIFVADGMKGHCQASMVQYSSDNVFRATSATVHTPGTGFAVHDTVTLTDAAATKITSHATFVVKTLVSGTTGIESFYDLNDAEAPLDPASSAGNYSITGDNPLDQGAGTPQLTTAGSRTGSDPNGTGLKIDVNYSNIAVARIYWTSMDHQIRWIEPNNTDSPEIIGLVSKTGSSQSRSTSYMYQVMEVDGVNHYGFKVAGEPNTMTNIKLYELKDYGGTAVNNTAKNAYSGITLVQKFEGQTSKRLECCQWNPIKRRLYVSGRGTSLMHIFSVPGNSGDKLKTFFESTGVLTYEKTIGIPGLGTGQQGGDHAYLNSTHVDWDVDTGEEKSITMSRYALQGTVTRASWKED